MSAEQAKAVLTAAAGDRFEAAYRLMLSLGLRPGECLALSWSDVDLVRHRVSVRHSLQRDGIIGPPKNESSVRQLPLSSSVVASLNKRREIQEVEHQGAAEYWQGYGDDLDFSTQVGTPTNDRNLARTFLLLCSKAKVGVWVPYELRHTFATLALEAGMPIQKVSKVLGHSDIRETAGTYAHVTPRHLRDVVEAMDAVLA